MDDFDWLSQWLERKLCAETGLISNTTFSDENASSGICFSFTLQAYFHYLYLFIEIQKIIFYLVSKHLSHCVRSMKVLRWKPLTVSQVFCLHCHCNRHRPRPATTCFNDGLENET